MNRLASTCSLTIKDLAIKYSSNVICQEINISATTNEIIGLLGPNGSGKTSIFYSILGMIPLHKGTITFDDMDITNYKLSARATLGISYLPQEPSIFRDLTVFENIYATLQLHSKLNKIELKEYTNEIINEFNLHKIKDKQGISLSGGERRRTEIARIYGSKPKFILLDEPFSGVDPLAISDLQNLIKKLHAQNIGIIITDHNVRETLEICSTTYVISQGRILTKGDQKHILQHEQVRRFYLGNNFN